MLGDIRRCILLRAKNCKYRNLMAVILVITGIVTAFLLITDISKSMISQKTILRNSYGEGSKKKQLQIAVDGKKLKEEMELEITERQYTAEETKELFQRASGQIERLMLAENKSSEEVRSDLNLLTEIPGQPIRIEWELDRYDVLDINGNIKEKAVEELSQEGENGIVVQLKAYLSYTEDETKQAVHEMAVCIYPPIKTGTEALLAEIKEEIFEINSENKTGPMIKLPEEVNGKEISYYYPMDFRGITVLVLGLVIVLLLFFLDRQNKKKVRDDKIRQMMQDYPQIVSQLNLLLSAGMSIKSAWKKIVDEYRKKKNQGNRRYAYDEMEATWNEMCSGVPERECYEQFGARCKIQAYIKLGTLLSQNLRKGTKGLADMLRLEGIHAFEERKALAKRLGEEAGTKLLLPMFFMLAVVMMIIIVPAFLSIRL